MLTVCVRSAGVSYFYFWCSVSGFDRWEFSRKRPAPACLPCISYTDRILLSGLRTNKSRTGAASRKMVSVLILSSHCIIYGNAVCMVFAVQYHRMAFQTGNWQWEADFIGGTGSAQWSLWQSTGSCEISCCCFIFPRCKKITGNFPRPVFPYSSHPD